MKSRKVRSTLTVIENKVFSTDEKPINEPNPERGDRSDFKKVTITMHPIMIKELRNLGTNRKLLGFKDTDVSSLIREAVKLLLYHEKIRQDYEK